MKFDLAQRIAEANTFELKDDRDYAWILDYAKYRLSQSASNVKSAEQKAGDLLKLILTAAGGAWLVFLFLVKEVNLLPKDCLNYWEIVGFIVLACSAFCALAALFPLRRLSLIRERAAINFVNEKEPLSKKPVGRFSLSLMICSDFCEKVATAKSYWIAAGLTFLAVAVALIILGFSLLCLSQTGAPNPSLRAEVAIPWALQRPGVLAGLTCCQPLDCQHLRSQPWFLRPHFQQHCFSLPWETSVKVFGAAFPLRIRRACPWYQYEMRDSNA